MAAGSHLSLHLPANSELTGFTTGKRPFEAGNQGVRHWPLAVLALRLSRASHVEQRLLSSKS